MNGVECGVLFRELTLPEALKSGNDPHCCWKFVYSGDNVFMCIKKTNCIAIQRQIIKLIRQECLHNKHKATVINE